MSANANPQAGPLHHFDSWDQQREAASLGMWVFLAQEVLFFGGLFACYTLYRWSYPAAFALGSHHMDVFLGTVNTAVLIGSSFTVVMAVRSAQLGKGRTCATWLALTILLGGVFLGIKSFEYHHKWVDHLVPGPHFQFEGPEAHHVQLFYFLYFAMTGLHAFHMIIGIGVLLWMIPQALKGRFTPQNHNYVEGFGLYWHFVDIVWIFLFPLLYLIGRHG